MASKASATGWHSGAFGIAARPPFEVLKAFIDQHRDTFGVEPICKVFRIAPSGYRRHATQLRDPSTRCARAKRDEMLCPEINRVWQANLQVYGADKVWKQMNRERIIVARCTVERLMKRLGLRGASPEPAKFCTGL
ncbi:hypothetical protein OKW46_000329 [Paraburkholderia sp. WSM4179]|nr:hypothetical protein [Paraburkholderia sp. WSM4179]